MPGLMGQLLHSFIGQLKLGGQSIKALTPPPRHQYDEESFVFCSDGPRNQDVVLEQIDVAAVMHPNFHIGRTLEKSQHHSLQHIVRDDTQPTVLTSGQYAKLEISLERLNEFLDFGRDYISRIS